MALDKEYFDAIHIDVVKKKYYNANKVEAVFSDIRSQAEALYEENQRMHGQLEAVNGKKFEIGDAVLSAQAIYREIVDKANARAESILEDAERQRAQIVDEARRQQEYAVQRVESCYTNMKQQHQDCIDAINAQWQDFLCGLFPEAGMQTTASPEPAMETEDEESVAMEDIEEKIGAIARELFSMGQDDSETEN